MGGRIGEMEIIVAVIIAVVGWILTHWLTIKAQNKNFINRVVNDARLEIRKAIRDYQNWLSKVGTTILTLDIPVILQEEGISANWRQRIDELGKLFYRDSSTFKWALRLEEYEILFPKTAECRKDLLGWHTRIRTYLDSFLRELESGFPNAVALPQRKKAIEKAKNGLGIVFDQEALMEDLRIYLENLCLSSFTGSKIPERKPGDSSAPRLVQGKNGLLTIVPPENRAKNGGG